MLATETGAGVGLVSETRKVIVDIASLKDVLAESGIELFGDDKSYTQAFNQFYKDIDLLLMHQDEINGLMKSFAEALSAAPVFDLKASDTVFAEVLAEFDEKYGYEGAAATDGPKIGAALVEAIAPAATDFRTLNYKALMTLVVNTMHACHERVDLSYHNAGHAFEMMHDAPYLARTNRVDLNWSVFLSVCGLFHDAVFLRSRVQDEQHSAALLQAVLKPFIDKLTPAQQALFNAMIRVIIVGGTLPVFEKEKEHGKTRMRTLWEVYETLYPVDAGNNVLKDILKACRSMSDADVQRSLTAELLTDYPATKAIGVPELLQGIIKDYFVVHPLQAGDKLQELICIIAVKLGQSIRMASELKKPGEVMEDLSPVKAKMAAYLRSGAWVDFTPEELKEVSESLINNEKFFADMNLYGLSEDPMQAAPAGAGGPSFIAAARRNSISMRRNSLQISSWLWHKAVYDEVKTKMSSVDGNFVLKALLDNARNQQGLMLDFGRFIEFLNAGLVVAPRPSVALSEVMGAVHKEQEEAAPGCCARLAAVFQRLLPCFGGSAPVATSETIPASP